MTDLFSGKPSINPSIKTASATVLNVIDVPEINGQKIEIDGGELLFSENFFSKKLSDRVVEYFQENKQVDWKTARWGEMSETDFDNIEFTNIRWKQDHIKFFGKTHPLPRLTSWYGDPGASYKYSGIYSDPNPWNDGLLYVKSKVEAALGVCFNSVLLNWYRDGSDSLSWHADDERELGPEPIIASASFGDTRDFLFRRKDDKDQNLALKLHHGSLVVMKGTTQQHWVHSVPKRKSSSSRSRFNLTFRQIFRG